MLQTTTFQTQKEAFEKDYAEKAHLQKSMNSEIVAYIVQTLPQWFPT